MESQLDRQVRTRIKQLEEMKKQLETTEELRKEKWREYYDFKRHWQQHCNHIFYRIQSLGGGFIILNTSYECCLCGKSTQELQDFVATFKHPGFCSYYLSENQEKVDLKAPFPIPSERQSEVDQQKEKMNEIRSIAKCLERKERKLQPQINTLERELTAIAHLLNDALGIPEIIFRQRHRWGPDDFNYDPFE